MRPVNKGDSPYVTLGDYGEALPFLASAIGLYCSYCGFPLFHVPEVEHVVAKAKGGELTAWKNLLLSCKYCNTRKKALVDKANVDEYLWPDQYNTALAYTYEFGMPEINESSLLAVDPKGIALNKAQNLFDLVKLDNIPGPKEKDRRFNQRNKAYETAVESLGDYRKIKETNPEHVEEISRQIVRTALYSGFFSVWMSVFVDEPEILNMFILAFPGTEQEFFGEDGLPKPVLARP